MRLIWGRGGGDDEVQWQQDGSAVGGKKIWHGRSAFDHARVALCPLAGSFQLNRNPTLDCEHKPTWTLFLGDVGEGGCNLKIACTGQQRAWVDRFDTEPSMEQAQAFSGNLPERKGMQGTGDQVDELIRSSQVGKEGRAQVWRGPRSDDSRGLGDCRSPNTNVEGAFNLIAPSFALTTR